jgi:hypothetical protein
VGWLLFASILFAGWRCRFIPRLYQYFFAQALYTVVLFNLRWLVGDTSRIYAAAYSLLTGIILLAVGRIATENLSGHQYSCRGAVIAGVLAIILVRLAFVGLQAPVRYYEWIHLIEAGALIWAGLCVAGTAPYCDRWDIAFTLGMLWLVQALFRLGFILHLPSETWVRYNWIVPPAACIIAFTAIGLLEGRDRRTASAHTPHGLL